MALGQEKIKEFFEEKAEALGEKIEKTPMEKFFVFFLIVISISAVVLGYLQFKKNLEQPLFSSYLYDKRSDIREKYQAVNLNTGINQEEIVKLQNQDSDLDGLDDYSEINIYHTNPYLQDTDNDGILDKQEILAGTDPNCPEGQDCTMAQFTESDQGFNANLNQTEALTNQPAVDLSQLQDLLPSGNINLSDMGISDAQLEQMFGQLSASGTEDADTLSVQPTPEEQALFLEEMKKLTPAEIRQELISRGMDKTLLDKIDDQTLQQMFLDTLNIQ